jgi:hypothetical protein
VTVEALRAHLAGLEEEVPGRRVVFVDDPREVHPQIL